MKQSAFSPVIAITTATNQQVDANGFQKTVSRINNKYIALVTDFGGIPLLLYAESDPRRAKEILKRVDGLIVIGGQDLDPRTYGQDCVVKYDASLRGAGQPFHRPHDLMPNRKRDDFELSLYAQAIEIGTPVLGICRGLQLINVAEGGTLHQEIPFMGVDHCAGGDGFVHHHSIEIAPDTFTYRTLEATHYYTSSIHHQGIDRLGSKLTKAAWAPDGVIEIIERVDDKHFVIGVHGHMEQTRKNLPLNEKLLGAFMSRCSKSASL